jgi:hypothetical protein
MAATASAMASVGSTACRGLPDGPLPAANGARNGNTPSFASDCRMRGAPRNDASADDSVAAMTPTSINIGIPATRRIAAKSDRSTSPGSAAAKRTEHAK